MKMCAVDINRASPKTLERLPLIGPKRAARIVAYRNTHGWFGSVDDLDRVPGIFQVNKLRTLDHPAAGNVKTRDDPFGRHIPTSSCNSIYRIFTR